MAPNIGPPAKVFSMGTEFENPKRGGRRTCSAHVAVTGGRKCSGLLIVATVPIATADASAVRHVSAHGSNRCLAIACTEGGQVPERQRNGGEEHGFRRSARR